MSTSDHTNNGIPVGIGYDSKDRAKSLMELSSISVSQVSATTYINVPSVGGITEVSGMGDVCIGETPSGGQAMVWSAVPGCWVASTIPTGTAGGGPFVTIATNTQLSANVVSNGLTITELTASTWGTSEAITTNITNIGTNSTSIGTNSTNIGTNSTNIGTNSTNIGTNATTITELTASSWGVSSYITANEAAWNAGEDLTELTASSWEYSGAIDGANANISFNAGDIFALQASTMALSAYISEEEGGWGGGGGDHGGLEGLWDNDHPQYIFSSVFNTFSSLLGAMSLQDEADYLNFSGAENYDEGSGNDGALLQINDDSTGWYLQPSTTFARSDQAATVDNPSTQTFDNLILFSGAPPGSYNAAVASTDLLRKGEFDSGQLAQNVFLLGILESYAASALVGGVLKASGTSTASIANTTVTLGWDPMLTNANVGSIAGTDITVSATGIYKLDCNISVTGSNRIQLIASASINGLDQAADVYHNYAVRDSDQNTGSLSFSTVFDMVGGDVINIDAHGNVDSNGVLKPVGTTVILTYQGPH